MAWYLHLAPAHAAAHADWLLPLRLGARAFSSSRPSATTQCVNSGACIFVDIYKRRPPSIALQHIAPPVLASRLAGSIFIEYNIILYRINAKRHLVAPEPDTSRRPREWSSCWATRGGWIAALTSSKARQRGALCLITDIFIANGA